MSETLMRQLLLIHEDRHLKDKEEGERRLSQGQRVFCRLSYTRVERTAQSDSAAHSTSSQYLFPSRRLIFSQTTQSEQC